MIPAGEQASSRECFLPLEAVSYTVLYFLLLVSVDCLSAPGSTLHQGFPFIHRDLSLAAGIFPVCFPGGELGLGVATIPLDISGHVIYTLLLPYTRGYLLFCIFLTLGLYRIVATTGEHFRQSKSRS